MLVPNICDDGGGVLSNIGVRDVSVDISPNLLGLFFILAEED